MKAESATRVTVRPWAICNFWEEWDLAAFKKSLMLPGHGLLEGDRAGALLAPAKLQCQFCFMAGDHIEVFWFGPACTQCARKYGE